MVDRYNNKKKDLLKRKESGKYYTPEFITEYICLNTIIPNLSNKSSKTIKDLIEEFSGNIGFLETQIRKIKIIDPACGLGVFLLKSAKILREIYKEIYKIKRNNIDFKDLSIDIIKNNIFGVDLDADAIECTKKILINFCYSNSKIGVSPDLNKNIVLGDSLFSARNKKIKDPLNWNSIFPHIFRQGGFNVVVGNPPYVDIKELNPDIVEIIFEKFSTAKNRTNLFSIFIEQSIDKILKYSGYLGFIVPNSLLMNSSYSLIRKKLLEMTEIKEIMRLPNKIFKAKVETIILILQKRNNPKISNVKIITYSPTQKITSIDPSEFSSSFNITSQHWLSDEFNRFKLINNKIYKILEKIELNSILLGTGENKICDFSLGITPYDKYKGHTKEQIKNKVFHSERKIDEFYKSLISGGDIARYIVKWSGKNYIKYGSWLGAPRNERFFTEPRIIIRQIVSGKNSLRILAAYTDEILYNTQTAFSVIIRDKNAFEVKYVLALLNSKLMNYYHRNKFLDENKKTFQKILIENAKKFPIKRLNLKIQLKISNLVDLLMEKALKIRNISQNEIKPIMDTQRQIQEFDLIDKKIDAIIYKIYNLEADEVSLIERIPIKE